MLETIIAPWTKSLITIHQSCHALVYAYTPTVGNFVPFYSPWSSSSHDPHLLRHDLIRMNRKAHIQEESVSVRGDLGLRLCTQHRGIVVDHMGPGVIVWYTIM